MQVRFWDFVYSTSVFQTWMCAFMTRCNERLKQLECWGSFGSIFSAFLLWFERRQTTYIVQLVHTSKLCTESTADGLVIAISILVQCSCWCNVHFSAHCILVFTFSSHTCGLNAGSTAEGKVIVAISDIWVTLAPPPPSLSGPPGERGFQENIKPRQFSTLRTFYLIYVIRLPSQIWPQLFTVYSKYIQMSCSHRRSRRKTAGT